MLVVEACMSGMSIEGHLRKRGEFHAGDNTLLR